MAVAVFQYSFIHKSTTSTCSHNLLLPCSDHRMSQEYISRKRNNNFSQELANNGPAFLFNSTSVDTEVWQNVFCLFWFCHLMTYLSWKCNFNTSQLNLKFILFCFVLIQILVLLVWLLQKRKKTLIHFLNSLDQRNVMVFLFCFYFNIYLGKLGC